jgi:hypothetical protein
MTDEQIVKAMETYKISPAQMAEAVGLKEGEVAARVGAAIPPNQAVLLGDTYVQAVNQVTGSGENEQVGALENVITYKASDNKVGGDINYYSPTGEYQQTTQQQKVDTSLGGALKDIVSNPGFKIIAAAYGLDAALSAFGATGATGLTLAELGGTAGAGALTAAESAALYGTGSALGGAGVIGSDLAGLSGIPAGTGALTAAESAALFGTGGAGLMGTGAGLTVAGTTGLGGSSGLASLGGAPGAGVTLGTAGLGALGTGAGLGTAGLTTAGLVGANTLLGGAGLGTTLAGLGAGVGGSLLGAAAGSKLGSLLSSGLTLGGGLLQSQTSKEAAQKAQAMIEAETAAAKQSAAFRPVGMTTRFGTSQFGFDPKTGLPTAGYTLSPEAKNAQDRFITLAGAGLTQAEGAQEKFKPLQTGAESLFTLGSKYLAKTPEDVAKDYLTSQMALLKPSRDLELANIETRLRNQGRLGLSVAQGGNLGAASPELQALYNARATQEAQLAANAQQYGQQNVLFGAGLLGQGSQAMGQYYGGQQQAYTPYTTALGQVQNLETLGQQPYNMGVNLGQIGAQTGFNVGQLGLGGAKLSTALATSDEATNNPYAQLLAGLGGSTAFGTLAGNAIGGLFS